MQGGTCPSSYIYIYIHICICMYTDTEMYVYFLIRLLFLHLCTYSVFSACAYSKTGTEL